MASRAHDNSTDLYVHAAIDAHPALQCRGHVGTEQLTEACAAAPDKLSEMYCGHGWEDQLDDAQDVALVADQANCQYA